MTVNESEHFLGYICGIVCYEATIRYCGVNFDIFFCEILLYSVHMIVVMYVVISKGPRNESER